MITWISGNTGSGKTYIAKALQEKYGGVILDGDEIRKIWLDLGFNKSDRWENNLRVARLAKTLDQQGFNVIVSTICPYQELRKEVKKITHCKFIFVAGGEVGEEFPYEMG